MTPIDLHAHSIAAKADALIVDEAAKLDIPFRDKLEVIRRARLYVYDQIGMQR